MGGASRSGIKALEEEDTRGKDPGCGGEREKRQHRGAGEMSPFRAPTQAHSKEAGKWEPKTFSPGRGGGAARG